MTPRKIKIRQEEKSAAKDYLKKAEDNYKAMLSALKDKNFNAAGTLALQCAISSSDAICVYEKGIRSISEDHFDVCDLVSSITLPDAKEKSTLLRRIINKKNHPSKLQLCYIIREGKTFFFSYVSHPFKKVSPSATLDITTSTSD